MNFDFRGGSLLSRQIRVRVKNDISDETIKALNSYLSSFSRKPYTVECSEQGITLHFADLRDLRPLQIQFPGLITEVIPHSDE
jgi:hypothetical protein